MIMRAIGILYNFLFGLWIAFQFFTLTSGESDLYMKFDGCLKIVLLLNGINFFTHYGKPLIPKFILIIYPIWVIAASLIHTYLDYEGRDIYWATAIFVLPAYFMTWRVLYRKVTDEPSGEEEYKSIHHLVNERTDLIKNVKVKGDTIRFKIDLFNDAVYFVGIVLLLWSWCTYMKPNIITLFVEAFFLLLLCMYLWGKIHVEINSSHLFISIFPYVKKHEIELSYICEVDFDAFRGKNGGQVFSIRYKQADKMHRVRLNLVPMKAVQILFILIELLKKEHHTMNE